MILSEQVMQLWAGTKVNGESVVLCNRHKNYSFSLYSNPDLY